MGSRGNGAVWRMRGGLSPTGRFRGGLGQQIAQHHSLITRAEQQRDRPAMHQIPQRVERRVIVSDIRMTPI